MGGGDYPHEPIDVLYANGIRKNSIEQPHHSIDCVWGWLPSCCPTHICRARANLFIHRIIIMIIIIRECAALLCVHHSHLAWIEFAFARRTIESSNWIISVKRLPCYIYMLPMLACSCQVMYIELHHIFILSYIGYSIFSEWKCLSWQEKFHFPVSKFHSSYLY